MGKHRRTNGEWPIVSLFLCKFSQIINRNSKKIYIKISPKNAVSLRIPQKTRSFLSTSTQFIIMLPINETNSRANTKKRNETPAITLLSDRYWLKRAKFKIRSPLDVLLNFRVAVFFSYFIFFFFHYGRGFIVWLLNDDLQTNFFISIQCGTPFLPRQAPRSLPFNVYQKLFSKNVLLTKFSNTIQRPCMVLLFVAPE